MKTAGLAQQQSRKKLRVARTVAQDDKYSGQEPTTVSEFSAAHEVTTNGRSVKKAKKLQPGKLPGYMTPIRTLKDTTPGDKRSVAGLGRPATALEQSFGRKQSTAAGTSAASSSRPASGRA